MTAVAVRLDVGNSFFRTIMLVLLGLCVLGWLNTAGSQTNSSLLLALSATLSFIGFVFWTLGRSRLGGYTALLLALSTGACLTVHGICSSASGWAARTLSLATAISSALLLGSILAAMLLGHSYLTTPAMSMQPLRRFIWWIAGSIAGRSLIAGGTLVLGISGVGAGSVPRSSEHLWWAMMAARWVIGLIGSAILTWMVWQTARIRSTQSATGILYAAVVLVLFGELVGQLIGQ